MPDQPFETFLTSHGLKGFKVQLFWEGHKNLAQSSSRFWHLTWGRLCQIFVAFSEKLNFTVLDEEDSRSFWSKQSVHSNEMTSLQYPILCNGTQITQLAYSSLLFILICLRIFLWTDAICPQSCCWLWHAITTSKVTATSLHCKYTQWKLGHP